MIHLTNYLLHSDNNPPSQKPKTQPSTSKKAANAYTLTCNPVADYFKTQPVVKAWIFGSVARGEETPLSDVDILVVLDHTQPIGLKFYGMWNDLEQLLDRSVDLVTESSLADFARESVERDTILIYERAA